MANKSRWDAKYSPHHGRTASPPLKHTNRSSGRAGLGGNHAPIAGSIDGRVARSYGRGIQRALYFPLISPPASAWLTRALLYWDEVGTIVPDTWVNRPELLGDHTLELVRRGLLRQVFPSQVHHRHEARFGIWLRDLGEDELAARRARFDAGKVARIHQDKWLSYGSALSTAMGCDLARGGGGRKGWIEVEERTAAEFMASLALDLCHPESDLSRPDSGPAQSWVPATGDGEAFIALLGGLIPQTPGNDADRKLSMRIRGEVRVGDLRTSVLERALPVPGDMPSPERLERFKARHGDRLPALRRHLEELIDSRLNVGDEVLAFRAVDRLGEEIEELVSEAERYLSEAGLRRLRRSPLIRIVKAVPLLSSAAAVAQETAQSLETATQFDQRPLAYFALARAELGLADGYGLSPSHAALVETFA